MIGTRNWGGMSHHDILADITALLANAPPAPPPPPRFIIRDAQQQMRTTRDVPGGNERVKPRPPSKAAGRRGTRKAWKRKHPPHWRAIFLFREPEDILVIAGEAMQPFKMPGMKPLSDVWLVTPAQHAHILKLVEETKR